MITSSGLSKPSMPIKNLRAERKPTRELMAVENAPSIAQYEILSEGPLVPINLYTANTQTESCISVLETNKTVISWTSNAQDARYSTTATRVFGLALEDGSEETFLGSNDVHAKTVALRDNRYAMHYR